jgi:outer membrane protein OmpA-like peptidoglycan-associated protein
MTTKPAFRALSIVLVAALGAGCGGSAGGATTPAPGTTVASGGGGSEHEEETGEEDADGEFHLSESSTASQAHGEHPSEITSTETEAALRFFVVDPDAGAIQGVVIKLEGADGRVYYTDETDAQGYGEVLVLPGQRYDLEYLSLGRRTTTAHVDVPPGPRQDITLTLRYHQRHAPRTELTPGTPPPDAEHLVLDGILFESGSATLDPESNPRLDRVVEYMTHRPSVRIRISGHTDNVGDPRRNQQLSQQRAEAVRAYLVAHGIDGGRVEAVGLGDTQPVAPNDTEEGRARNRRIEAMEL